MISSGQQQTFHIAKSLAIKVKIEHNPYQLSLDDCFKMALRNNKKRAFLFVSKWLGKHIPIEPKKSLFIGALLGYEYKRQKQNEKVSARIIDLIHSIFNKPRELDESEWVFQTDDPVTFIGFAETATALGYSMFRCFPNSRFFHTTREEVVGRDSFITFEEEHSHATSHRCYVDESYINHQEEIVLIDDELTTGKTVRNIIRSIQKHFPRKRYTVVTILDWRSPEDRELFKELEQECNCEVRVVSLIRGTMTLNQTGPLQFDQSEGGEKSLSIMNPEITLTHLSAICSPPFEMIRNFSLSSNMETYQVPFLKETGRFGLQGIEIPQIEYWIKNLAQQLKKERGSGRLLCLGSEEFMYLPMLLASELGEDVLYQSTTRSPIHVQQTPDYGILRGSHFPAPIDEEISHYVYNILENQYNEIWVFYERMPKLENVDKMREALMYTGVKKINIFYFLKGE
ncbi:phosphoribosyltransferase-like predicted ribonucleoside biosynthesis protein [Bacillus oleivorans]|uniref:Phosphoribosyltransferase-like predicted ribonucleoside biosynthesis protein n=2 Tax=Bacillus oleivorans TaxID=1448271 RepID=A0A285CL34_9BACI|nr:phosphoribosyltransferase-like predicted ribonucleoside biosynthesis protein [Bacillus oleivorans]